MKKISHILTFSVISLLSSSLIASADPALVENTKTLLKEAVTTYNATENYQSFFEREVHVVGKPEKKERTFIRFEKPFTIFMSWISGHSVGLQILFSEGNYENKILARPGGFFFNFIPIVRLDQDDPRVQKDEAEPINKAGIGHFLEAFNQDFDESLAKNEVDVIKLEDIKIKDEDATQITAHFTNKDRKYPYTKMAFSKDHKLPIQMERCNSETDCPEVYRYLQIITNIPRTNDTLKKQIDVRLFQDFNKIPENPKK